MRMTIKSLTMSFSSGSTNAPMRRKGSRACSRPERTSMRYVQEGSTVASRVRTSLR